MHRILPASSLNFPVPPPALPPAARRLLTLGALGLHLALGFWLLRDALPATAQLQTPALAVDLVPPSPQAPTPAAPSIAAPAAHPRAALPRTPAPLAPRPILTAPAPAPAVAAAETTPITTPMPVAGSASTTDRPAIPKAPEMPFHATATDPAAAPASAPELPPSAIAYRDPPAPEYPRAARRAGEAGLAVVRVFVDETGQPRAVQLVRSSGHARLDAAATDAVLRARFHPPTDHGRATAGWARIPIPFTLEPHP